MNWLNSCYATLVPLIFDSIIILLYILCFSGVGIYEGVRVEGVDVEGGRVTGVRTNKGNVSCEIFVNCAGQVWKERCCV